MRKTTTLICLLIFIFSSIPVWAQKTSPKSILWRISGKGLSKPSYLFGAIDYICKDDYLWTKKMEECYGKCEAVCLAINIADSTVRSEAARALASNHKQFKDYFSDKEYASVKQFAKTKMELDLNMPKLQSLKPLAIQPFIIRQLLGCTNPVSYELRLLSKAKKDNKKIAGIETVAEYEGDIETTHFNDKVAAVLVEMANGSKYYHDYRSKLEHAYQQQDIQSVNTIFKGAKSFTKDDMKVFLNEKNGRWLSHMPALMSASSVFFIVNVINMGGEEGLVNQLRKAGYTVTAVH